MADCKDNTIETPGGKGLAWRVLTPFTSLLGFPSTRPYGFYKKHRTIWVSHVCCYLYYRLAIGTSDRSWLKNTNVVSIKMQAEERELSWQHMHFMSKCFLKAGTFHLLYAENWTELTLYNNNKVQNFLPIKKKIKKNTCNFIEIIHLFLSVGFDMLLSDTFLITWMAYTGLKIIIKWRKILE